MNIIEEITEDMRISDLRAFVTVATRGDEDEWETALDTVAGWAIKLTFARGPYARATRRTLRCAWELYVQLLSEVEA